MRKTLLLLLLTAVFCGAFARKTPQVAPAPQVPDSLRGFYLFTEGIKQAFIERDTAAARASLERSVEADSTYGPAWYELAELLLYNDAPAALRHAERAFRTDTTDKWYLLQLGQAQILNDRYRDAIRTYNRLREIDAQNPDSYRVLAMLYDQEGQPFSAIAVLDSAEVRFGRIDALSELKRRLLVGTRQYDRAVAEAQALIEAAPLQGRELSAAGRVVCPPEERFAGAGTIRRGLPHRFDERRCTGHVQRILQRTARLRLLAQLHAAALRER